MRIIRQPGVYLVGSQTTNEAEIDRFLGDHDVHNWSTDTEVAGEKLSEIALATVLMSSVLARPGTPSKMQCPLQNRAMSICFITSSCPTMIRATCVRIRS